MTASSGSVNFASVNSGGHLRGIHALKRVVAMLLSISVIGAGQGCGSMNPYTEVVSEVRPRLIDEKLEVSPATADRYQDGRRMATLKYTPAQQCVERTYRLEREHSWRINWFNSLAIGAGLGWLLGESVCTRSAAEDSIAADGCAPGSAGCTIEERKRDCEEFILYGMGLSVLYIIARARPSTELESRGEKTEETCTPQCSAAGRSIGLLIDGRRYHLGITDSEGELRINLSEVANKWPELRERLLSSIFLSQVVKSDCRD